MAGRMQKLLLEEDVRYDIVDAVIAAKPTDLAAIKEAAEVISRYSSHKPFKPAVENVARVINLAKKKELIKSKLRLICLKMMLKKGFMKLSKT